MTNLNTFLVSKLRAFQTNTDANVASQELAKPTQMEFSYSQKHISLVAEKRP